LRCKTAVLAAVLTVRTVLAAAEPGVTVAGAKVYVAPAGIPVADSVIGAVKLDPAGARVRS
jgi:hypothetical protein